MEIFTVPLAQYISFLTNIGCKYAITLGIELKIPETKASNRYLTLKTP